MNLTPKSRNPETKFFVVQCDTIGKDLEVIQKNERFNTFDEACKAYVTWTNKVISQISKRHKHYAKVQGFRILKASLICVEREHEILTFAVEMLDRTYE